MRRILRIALALSLLAAGLAAQEDQAPPPADQESHHRILLQNRYIRVVETYVPAGDSTAFHTHTRERIGVVVGPAPIEERIQGRIAVEERPEPAGTLHAGDYTQHPFTHRQWNIGERPYRVIAVELLQPLPNPPPEPKGPGDPDAQTPHLEAFRYVLPPGGASAMHTHTRPYLILAATSMKLKMIAPDGSSRIEDVLPGDFHWVEQKVTHELWNAGQEQGQVVEIELK